MDSFPPHSVWFGVLFFKSSFIFPRYSLYSSSGSTIFVYLWQCISLCSYHLFYVMSKTFLCELVFLLVIYGVWSATFFFMIMNIQILAVRSFFVFVAWFLYSGLALITFDHCSTFPSRFSYHYSSHPTLSPLLDSHFK